MDAIVPAAGQGSRLRPLTDAKPKPLVEVCGAPILAYCLDRLVDLDVDEIVIVVGYRGEQIVDHFGDEFAGTPLTYVWQRERKGMAHALLQAAARVDGDVAVMDGDNVVAGDLTSLLECHREPGIDGTLLLERVSARDAREKAICTVNDDGLVTDIVNKPDDPPDPCFVAGGFHTFPADVFAACERVEESPRGEYELSEAIERLLEDGDDIRGIEHDGWSVNVNTAADRREAAQYVREHRALVPEY